MDPCAKRRQWTSWKRVAGRILALVILCAAGLVPSQVTNTPAASAITTWNDIAVGISHSCALSSGRAYCWGVNGSGQLGDGTTTSSFSPKPVSTGLQFADLSVGPDFTCGLTTSNDIYCWGRNTLGQLGNGGGPNQSLPTPISVNRTWVSISSGLWTSCALDNTGVAYCWGQNGDGQLGDGTTTNRPSPTPIPSVTFASVSLGAFSGCGIRSDNSRVMCWGFNGNGELGDGTTAAHPSPAYTTSTDAASSISLGRAYGCMIRSSDSVALCWGSNAKGQLGNGNTTAQSNPVAISGSLTFASLATGELTGCGIRLDGKLNCWGDAAQGLIGALTSSPVLTPVTVSGSNNYSRVAMSKSGSTACAITTTFKNQCWGYGNVGNGQFNPSYEPVPQSGAPAFTSVYTGTNYACGLTATGVAYCWGNNSFGQLGTNDQISRTVPTPVATGLTFTSLTVYSLHSCGLTAAGLAYCWGWNQDSQLGDGTAINRFVPTPVSGGIAFSSISNGQFHTCGIRQSNSYVLCWGYGGNGQMGNGTVNSYNTPNLVVSLTFSSITSGERFTCALRSNGSSFCWGANDVGQLGINNQTGQANPSGTLGGIAFSRISAGSKHACGIRSSDGVAFCWGNNTDGQLGINSYAMQLSPAMVVGGLTFSSIAAGLIHTCAITTSSKVSCWGNNETGALGNGSAANNTSFTMSADQTNATQISSGAKSSCAIFGSVSKCWGVNLNGQLGTDIDIVVTPVDIDSPPDVAGLSQYRTDGTTAIATGGYSNQTSAILRTSVTDIDTGDTVKACFEFRPIGTAFTNVDTNCSAFVSPAVIGVTVPTSHNVSYHWQVRVIDGRGGTSAWTQYNNGATAFSVDTQTPNTPSGLNQFKSDTTFLSLGSWYSGTPSFTASVSDDTGTTPVNLCVEAKPIGTSFNGVDIACSGFVASGSIATFAISLPDNTYHWRARSYDAAGNYGSYSSYGGNAETAMDFGIDTVAPTAGTVTDGPSGVDVAMNDGTLTNMSATWTGFLASNSPLSRYDFAIGTSPGAIDTKGWTNVATFSTFSITSLSLTTGRDYYVSVRAVDSAGNISSIATSNGQSVLPTLAFTVASSSINYGMLNAANGYTATSTNSINVQTNARNGYQVFTKLQSPFTTSGGQTVGGFSGGTYASPDAWQSSDTGFGYSTSDTSVAGANRFNASTCLGGSTNGGAGCFAPFSTSGSGDVVLDNGGPAGTTPLNDTFNLKTRLTVSATQRAGSYTGALLLTAIPSF